MNREVRIRVVDIAYAIAKRWKMIILLTLSCTVFGIVMTGVSRLQGRSMNYEITCSFAVAPQQADGMYLGNSQYPAYNDFLVAQDMADAAIYITKSEEVIKEALQNSGISASVETVQKNLTLSRFNETQIIEMTLDWSSRDDGVTLANAILAAAGTIMPETLKMGSVSVINPPEAVYTLGGTLSSYLWIVMTLIGLAAGIGTAVLDLVLRPTLLNLDDVENVLGIEITGVIPENALYYSVPEYKKTKDEFAHTNQDYISASYIVGNVLADEKAPRCFYVTSTTDGEGKTTAAANIAMALADMEKKVLLLDLNTRNPKLAEKFLEHPDYKHTINAYYHGEAGKQEAICHITGFLDLLPCAAGLRISDTLLDFIRKLSKDYDYVIMDTDSVEKHPEILRLNRVTSNVLFVIHHDLALLSDIQNSLERLTKSGANLIGAIVTGTQRTNVEAVRYAPAYQKEQEYPDLFSEEDSASENHPTSEEDIVPDEDMPMPSEQDSREKMEKDSTLLSDEDLKSALDKMGIQHDKKK